MKLYIYELSIFFLFHAENSVIQSTVFLCDEILTCFCINSTLEIVLCCVGTTSFISLCVYLLCVVFPGWRDRLIRRI
jgi:hypothetical protein